MLKSVMSGFKWKSSKHAVASMLTMAAALVAFRRYASTNSPTPNQLEKERRRRLLVITGCDSGLGYSMATWSANLGYKVLAGCLNENGHGATKLRKRFPSQVITAGLNVTDICSLQNFRRVCTNTLEQDKEKLCLWAIIPNAAVCTMGEFFWQTDAQREQQMNVNFWGTVNFVSEFRGLIFENKARVVVVSSDCSNYPLPYLATYCASKAAVDAWTQSLRFEMIKYGVQVLSYHPRDFAQKSALFSSIETSYNDMEQGMSEPDKQFYGDYFHNFMNSKKFFSSAGKPGIDPVDSSHHRDRFFYTLEKDISGISVYADSSWSEYIFHMLYKHMPQRYVDKLVNITLNPNYRTVYWKPPTARLNGL